VEFLQQFSGDVQGALIRIGLALVALVGIWLLRRAIIHLALRPIRSIARRRNAEWDGLIAHIVDQPARYVALAIWLLISVRILAMPTGLATGVTNLARSLIVIAAFVVLFKTVDLIARTSRSLARLTGLTLDEKMLPFMRTAIKLIIIALAIVAVMQEWGYNVSGLVAGLGLGGLAFSLAAQDTVANLFGFSTIVGDRPFTVGDFVVTSDVTGIVETVGLRSTRIRRLDQALVTVPNNVLANSVVTNWSGLSKRWIQFTFGVTYATTADQMESLIQRVEAMLRQREHVDPETIQVVFTEFGSSSLDVLVRCYVDLADWYPWMKEVEAVNLAVMRIVADMGLSMAFPSQSVYIESVPPGWPMQPPENSEA
jgi:MscS family membrane protein